MSKAFPGFTISIHALPAEGDWKPCRKAPPPGLISIHALPAEGDVSLPSASPMALLFQSTPSPRRATGQLLGALLDKLFQSTPSPRRATCQQSIKWLRLFLFQSTPSPRRATWDNPGSCDRRRDFNPRPPRGGRQPVVQAALFCAQDFNPRPPRGGRRAAFGRHPPKYTISIHALPAEGDLRCPANLAPTPSFQSTPSPRRATKWLAHFSQRQMEFQSTPSPRRATLSASAMIKVLPYFNPRPPRGGRPLRSASLPSP